MALQINLSAEQSTVGAAFPNAYARIVGMQYELKKDEILIFVDIHADQAARGAGKNPIGGNVYKAKNGVDTADLDAATSPGVRKVLYNYLKTLPEFQAAADV